MELELTNSSSKDMTNLVRSMLASPSNFQDPSSKPPTIVHAIVQSDLPASEKTFDRITDDVKTITGAAFETTAQVLRVTLYYIYTNRNVLGKLREELATTKLSTSPVDYASLEKLPYLTAVLMEGLRLMPGICTRMARIAPDRDLQYKDWRIPAGTPVGMTTLLMHLDETVYSEAHKFEPERWMDIETRKRADRTYAPFSRGTRNCIGMQ